MSTSSHSPKSERIFELDVSSQDPLSQNLIQEPPNPSNPSSEPDPDPHSLEEYGEGHGDGRGEPEGEGKEQEIPQTEMASSDVHLDDVPPIADPSVPVSDVCLSSPAFFPNPRRGVHKRRKGPNIKKRQLVQRKLQALILKLNPIPFIPPKNPDFSKHEQLLKKLGLWDFVKTDFGRDVRVDWITQLVASYDPKLKYGYVNNLRITLYKVDFANAFKLPTLKKKASVGGQECVDLDEELGEDSIGFIVDLVSDWMLLHDDTWMMPSEVMQWLKLIKDGHPEKVDWAGLLRFMMEKELMLGEQLGDCYYASHLQRMIRFEREDVFPIGRRVAEKMNLKAEMKEEASEVNAMHCGVADDQLKESCVMEEPNIELTLGQEGEKEENLRDDELMDAEKVENDGRSVVGEDEDEQENGGCEDNEEEGTKEQAGWFVHGKNNLGEHFLQPCNVEDDQSFGGFEVREEEEREMEGNGSESEARRFDAFPIDDDLHGEGLTGNFLQAMETNEVPFNSKEQISGPSSMDIRDDMHHMVSSPSFFKQVGKRVIDHDNDVSHHPLTDSNKRLRINDSWNHKPVDFGMCMEQIQQTMVRVAMIFGEKEQELEQSNMNQQILVDELQKRDTVIERLHKTRLEEVQKKDGEIYRLERELYLMGSVVDGYRKALKDSQKAFAEYRQRAQLPEEPTYKDAGPGGLMLSTVEIEKMRQKRDEYNMNCLAAERKIKEFEESYSHQFDEFVDKISSFDKKLAGFEADAKELIQIYAKRKVPSTEGEVPEVAKSFPNEQ